MTRALPQHAINPAWPTARSAGHRRPARRCGRTARRCDEMPDGADERRDGTDERREAYRPAPLRHRLNACTRSRQRLRHHRILVRSALLARAQARRRMDRKTNADDESSGVRVPIYDQSRPCSKHHNESSHGTLGMVEVGVNTSTTIRGGVSYLLGKLNDLHKCTTPSTLVVCGLPGNAAVPHSGLAIGIEDSHFLMYGTVMKRGLLESCPYDNYV
ncbi:hypothetical protein CALVIDRAFT_415562 [Calocera viscosa TUFC12733]|uniref:Uncharacterized protein n=1 Tax=Calocera viscosa (strain TUFC12733) TaxID=1330018 RepID=A0A167G078_CALVF|nr:hypothetical protein CALVIDRAFT_415562 [Calocera viscosa TUFC12733]